MVPAGIDLVDSHYTPGPGPVVLPAEKYGVSDVMEMTNQRIGDWAKNKAAEQKQQKAVTQKMLEGLKTDIGKPLDKDVPELLAESEKLTNMAADFIAQGKDPSNPKNYKEWSQLENAKKSLSLRAQASNQHRTQLLEAEKTLDDLEQAGKPVDRQLTNEEIAKRHDLPLSDRMNQSGSLIKMKGFDGDQYMREDLFGKNSPFKPGKVSEIKKDPSDPSLTYVEEVEGRNQDQIMQATKYALNSKPEFKDWVYKKLVKLKEEHPEAYQGYVDHAQSLVNDGHAVTADEVFAAQPAEIAYNEATKAFEYSRESNKNLKYDPKDAIAFRASVAAQERNKVGGSLYEKWKGMWSGNEKDWYPGADGKLHSAVFNGNQWGSPYTELGAPVTANILDIIDGGSDANGNLIRLFKTTKSAKDNPSNPYFPVVDMGQAMDQWIIGGSGELTNPAKATDVIQGTRVYGAKDGTYNKTNGKFAIKPVKGKYTSRDIPVMQKRLEEIATRRADISKKFEKLQGTKVAGGQEVVDELNKEKKALIEEEKQLKQKIALEQPETKKAVKVNSQEEFSKLPSGTLFLDASGVVKRKK